MILSNTRKSKFDNKAAEIFYPSKGVMDPRFK